MGSFILTLSGLLFLSCVRLIEKSLTWDFWKYGTALGSPLYCPPSGKRRSGPAVGVALILGLIFGFAGPAFVRAEAPSTFAMLELRTADIFTLTKLSGKFFNSVPNASMLNVEKIIAFEEHPHFVYLMGQSGKSSRRVVLLKPGTLVIEDRVEVPATGAPVQWTLFARGESKVEGGRLNLRGPEGDLSAEILLPKEASFRVASPIGDSGTATEHVVEILTNADGREARFLLVLQIHQAGSESPAAHFELTTDDDCRKMTLTDAVRTLKLSLPVGSDAAGTIAITKVDGQSLLDQRLLPSGIMPHGEKGIKMVQGWDRAYHDGARPSWDKGQPSSELVKLIDEGTVRPGRAVEFGCGTGTDAVYLASRGFEVTAIDIAPTALNRARMKADKAGVKVNWVLADVLAVPELGTFDFIYDRGCYHGIRRTGAARYVESLRRVSRPGTLFMVLAGNANEPPPHYGPPRVKEEQIRGELGTLFEFEWLREIRFDTIDLDQKGALAWSALLRRIDEP